MASLKGKEPLREPDEIMFDEIDEQEIFVADDQGESIHLVGDLNDLNVNPSDLEEVIEVSVELDRDPALNDYNGIDERQFYLVEEEGMPPRIVVVYNRAPELEMYPRFNGQFAVVRGARNDADGSSESDSESDNESKTEDQDTEVDVEVVDDEDSRDPQQYQDFEKFIR